MLEKQLRKAALLILKEPDFRFYIVKMGIVGFVSVFFVAFVYFYFKYSDPWEIFGKTLVVSLCALYVGMFSAILGRTTAWEQREGDDEGRADRRVSSSSEENSSENEEQVTEEYRA